MTAKQKIMTAIVVTVLLGTSGGYALWRINKNNNSTEGFKPKAEEGQGTFPDEDEPLEVTDAQASPNIAISNLSAGAVIRPGTKVEGQVLSPEGVLYVSIKGNQTGKVADYTVDVTSSTDSRPYSFEVIFERPPQADEKGVLSVYTKQDGVRAYSAQVEVVLR